MRLDLFFQFQHFGYDRLPDRLVIVGAETVDQCFLRAEIPFFIDLRDPCFLHQFRGGRFAGDAPYFAVDVIDELEECGFKDERFRGIVVMVVMLFHDPPDRLAESPCLEEFCAGFGVIDLQNGVFQFVKGHFPAGVCVVFHQFILFRGPVPEHVFADIVQVRRPDQFRVVDPVVIQNTFHQDPAGVCVVPFLFLPVAECLQNVGDVCETLDPVDGQHCHCIQGRSGVDAREGSVEDPEHLRQHHVVVGETVCHGVEVDRIGLENGGKFQHGAGGQGEGFQFLDPCLKQFLLQLGGLRYIFDQVVYHIAVPFCEIFVQPIL